MTNPVTGRQSSNPWRYESDESDEASGAENESDEVNGAENESDEVSREDLSQPEDPEEARLVYEINLHMDAQNLIRYAMSLGRESQDEELALIYQTEEDATPQRIEEILAEFRRRFPGAPARRNFL